MKNINCKLKIVFMGSPEIGAVVFFDLIKLGVKFDSVITRPDKPKGRGGKIKKTPVKIIAEKNNLTVYEPISKKELTKIIKNIKPDLCIVVAYGMIIPNEALEVPKFGMINFHPSLLPKYRGSSPITEPILNGDKKTGVSIIQISEEMDAGDVLLQKEIKLDGTETTPSLSEKLAHIGAKMIAKLIPQINFQKVSHVRQDDDNATYTNMIRKENGKIKWNIMDAETVEKMSRAFIPWPGVYSSWDNKKIDFYDIKVIKGNYKPGKVFEEKNKVIIGCKKNAISPLGIKLEGKKKVTSEEFLRGYPNFIESKLG